MERITVEQALLKQYDLKKEILDAIEHMHLAAGMIEKNNCLVGSTLSRQEFELQAADDYKNVKMLIQKYWKLVEAIERSDAMTYIETSCGEMTIRRARMMSDEIKRNSDATFIKKMIYKMEQEYFHASMSVTDLGSDKRRKLFQEMEEKIGGLLSSEDAELFSKLSKNAGEYKGSRFDPLDINGELEKLLTFEKSFPQEIQFLISFSNQKTYIDVDF